MGNGEINYSEFIAATLQTKIEVSEEHLWQLFEHFDSDKTGFISEENLAEVMSQAGKTLTSEEIKAMIKEVDLHKDGKIHFDEFKAMLGFETTI